MERSGTGGVDVSAQMSKWQPAGRRQALSAASGINLQASASAGRTHGVGVSVCRSLRRNPEFCRSSAGLQVVCRSLRQKAMSAGRCYSRR